MGNSIGHSDNKLEHEINHRGGIDDDETLSIKSYGSHKNRPFKDESHKGSAETIEGEEKRDASKEDLGLDEGNSYIAYYLLLIKLIIKTHLFMHRAR